MRQESVGSLVTFRCHTGHVMTAQVLAATQLDVLRNTLASALRQLNERAALCREMAEKYRASGNGWAAGVWEDASGQAAERELAIQALVKADWFHPESGDEEPALEKTPEQADAEKAAAEKVDAEKAVEKAAE